MAFHDVLDPQQFVGDARAFPLAGTGMEEVGGSEEDN
jgi:hypothetical protein